MNNDVSNNINVKKKKNKVLVIPIITFVLSILCLLGYFGYNKFFNDSDNKNKENKVNDIEDSGTIDESEIEQSEITVINSFSYHGNVKYSGNCFSSDLVEVNIDIPRIASARDNAMLLNKKIEEKYIKSMGITEDSVYDDKNSIPNVNYNFIKDSNYIYVYVVETNLGYCSFSTTTYKNYFYDITNDKILTMEEGFKAAGLTLQDLRDSSDAAKNITFDECDNSDCGCGLKIENNKLVPFYIDMCV